MTGISGIYLFLFLERIVEEYEEMNQKKNRIEPKSIIGKPEKKLGR